MKNKLFLSNIRKMKSSFKRFLSLVFLSLLGVGFFCGMKGASPSMIRMLNRYYEEHKVYDIEIISSLGFTDKDLEDLKKFNEIEAIAGLKSVDVLLKNEKTMKVISLSKLNTVDILEGNMPTKANEILIEEKMAKEQKLKVGSALTVQDSSLSETSFQIVGIIRSPLYFSNYRGTTNKGNGELNYYSYVLKDAFAIPFYTSVNLSLQTNASLDSKEYTDFVKESIEELKTFKTNSKATWMFFDLQDNPTHMSFLDATEGLNEIASVFPLIFFFVSVLISLISMTRMVREERGEIGILKAFGFSNRQIMFRYITYSFLATSLGGIIGCLIGFQVIPNIIWNIYTALFHIPNFIATFHFGYACLGLWASILSIVGASILSAYSTLRERPSELMRASSPKPGKKILFEKIPFVWRKLTFSNKVTMRNIFRYKRRVLVTIIGITGSTALILVGFGVKDSVENLVDYNYNRIFVYDAMIRLKEEGVSNDIENVLEKESTISSIVKASFEYVDISFGKMKKEVNLIVPEEKSEFTSAIKLNDIHHKKEEFLLEDGSIALSEKLSKMLNVSVGDRVALGKDSKLFLVSHIVENYINDYAYMTKNTYEKMFGTYHYNVIFIKQTESYDKAFDRVIQKNKNVSNFVHKKVSSQLMEDVLSSLNSVVIVLILSSAVLAFVILYNISTINISERKREISTLKVLGFYDEEVDSYITRENYILTFIGISLGLISDLFLCYYVISTCEPDNMMFLRDVKPFSYVCTAILSFLFTVIVGKIMHFSLKKIDMVESLKSVE